MFLALLSILSIAVNSAFTGSVGMNSMFSLVIEENNVKSIMIDKNAIKQLQSMHKYYNLKKDKNADKVIFSSLKCK